MSTGRDSQLCQSIFTYSAGIKAYLIDYLNLGGESSKAPAARTGKQRLAGLTITSTVIQINGESTAPNPNGREASVRRKGTPQMAIASRVSNIASDKR